MVENHILVGRKGNKQGETFKVIYKFHLRLVLSRSEKNK